MEQKNPCIVAKKRGEKSYRLVQKKKKPWFATEIPNAVNILVPGRFTVETAMAELPKVCRADLFGWECAREWKIISALVDIPEISTACFDGKCDQSNY